MTEARVPAAQLRQLPQARPSAGRRLRILVADHQEIVRWGFRVLLADQPWVERCVAAHDVDQAVALARRYDVDVALVELMFGADSGLRLCEALQAHAPSTRVVLMAAEGTMSPHLAQAAGAAAVVSKSWSAGDLAMAVRMVGLGLTLFDAAAAPSPTALSERERDVIRLIAAGATNREIGDRLYLSPNTVKQHASTAYRKLRARNRAQAVQRAQRLGLIG